ncbi:V8-like Glu-specific endopeptidase [Streptococcus pneumoniae]|nr:V8-like Glu-specific endopeptidase [Streptococcus pneumoniae]
MKKTVYKKLGISIIASTLLASQLSTVSALSVISSTGEEYEVSETLEKGPESNRLVRNLVHFIIDDGTN